MELYHRHRCSCGKTHDAGIERIICRRGAVEDIAADVQRYDGKRVFLLCDGNTYKAGGESVESVLKRAGISVSLLVLPSGIIPCEQVAGYVLMGYDRACDLIIGVGSGVISDLGKLLSATAKTPYFIVATAPSMDGFASATSSVEFNGLKRSLPTRSPNVVIGDLDILAKAPERMLISGLGDMLAKCVSVTEWRISNLINEEYYCENVAKVVRQSLAACISNANGLLARDCAAIEAIFLGLVQSGVAMNYAGLSRPASGVEHYFSHIWDMRGLAFGTPVDLHGIQCAAGTLYALRIYDYLLTVTPDKGRARAAVASFDRDAWFARLREFIGPGADAMIEAEKMTGNTTSLSTPVGSIG